MDRRPRAADASVAGLTVRRQAALWGSPCRPAPAGASHRRLPRESGEVNSISALATRFHVDHSYVARTLRLASLAPDIVESIVRGDEPDGLTLGRLMKGFHIPWREQRQALGHFTL